MHATPGSMMAHSMASLSGNRLQRRLRHSLLALFALTACAGLTLLASRPLPASAELAAATPTLTLATPAALATDAATSPQPQRKRAHVRRSHQSLAMPYFSFAAGN